MPYILYFFPKCRTNVYENNCFCYNRKIVTHLPLSIHTLFICSAVVSIKCITATVITDKGDSLDEKNRRMDHNVNMQIPFFFHTIRVVVYHNILYFRRCIPDKFISFSGLISINHDLIWADECISNLIGKCNHSVLCLRVFVEFDDLRNKVKDWPWLVSMRYEIMQYYSTI